jgi:hypothetical protein
MKNNPEPPKGEGRLRLKEPVGWFAAGDGFRSALGLLSDGAFKLFAYLSLQANRRTGCLAATHKGLAAAPGKSKRIIGSYVAELEAKEICKVRPGKNQFTATVYEISDRYWPLFRVNLCLDIGEHLMIGEQFRDDVRCAARLLFSFHGVSLSSPCNPA